MGILKESFSSKSTISNLRINITMITFTGCLCMIALTVAFIIKIIRKDVTPSDFIAFGTVICTFTGIGIYGKVKQKKEEKTTLPKVETTTQG